MGILSMGVPSMGLLSMGILSTRGALRDSRRTRSAAKRTDPAARIVAAIKAIITPTSPLPESSYEGGVYAGTRTDSSTHSAPTHMT